MFGSRNADTSTGIFAGVEQVAEGEDLQGLSRQEVRALAARAYGWESLLEDDLTERTRDSITETPTRLASANGNHALEIQTNTPERRGMVRHVFILVDMTEAMKLNDYRPRRFEFVVDSVLAFANKFLTENPLGALGLAILRSGTSEVVSFCTNSIENLQRRLQEMQRAGPQGRISLVNGLTSAVDGLKDCPTHSTREVLLLIASLSTHDPQESPIDTVLESLVEKRIAVSVISMSPELFILKQACTTTGGTYSAALDSRHFQELLDSHILPPVCTSNSAKPGLVLMGFPRRDKELTQFGPSGLNKNGQPQRLFICPRCDARVADVPGPCPVCELSLTSGLLLTRSFQHLFPMSPWVKVSSEHRGSLCCGCHLPFQTDRSDTFQCRSCHGHFCEDCTTFCRATLRKCPKCLEVSSKRLRTA